jgi:hypothetical protein
MRITRHNYPAWGAVYEAFRQVLPAMPEEQARQETTNDIAYPRPIIRSGSGPAFMESDNGSQAIGDYVAEA